MIPGRRRTIIFIPSLLACPTSGFRRVRTNAIFPGPFCVYAFYLFIPVFSRLRLTGIIF